MTVRLGFIGAGRHASNAIYPALRFADIELVAVADLDPKLAARNARRFGALRHYSDHRGLLESEDLDAVAVVGPPRMHWEIGLEVLAAGRHLFIEKPPGSDLKQAVELRDAARLAGRQVMVGFMKRHARAYAMAKRILSRPDFGMPSLLRLNYSHWKMGNLRDHLLFMSTHPLDLMRFFLGEVTRASVAKRSLGGEAVLALLAEHAGGGVSQVSLSALEPRVQESLEISGDSTLLQVTNLVELRYLHRGADVRSAVNTNESMAQLWYPEFTIPLADNESSILQGYAGEIQEFVAAIEGGRPPSPSIEDGVQAMRLVEAIRAAPEGLSDLVLAEV